MKRSYAITVDELRNILNTFENYNFVSMSYDESKRQFELYVDDELVVIEEELEDVFHYKEVPANG